MKSTFILIISLWATTILSSPLFSQQNSIGLFSGQTNIENTKISGFAKFDGETGMYELTSEFENDKAAKENIRFVYMPVSGDFNLYARCSFADGSAAKDDKLGLMIRNSLNKNSTNISAIVGGNGLVSLKSEQSAGENITEVHFTLTGADVIQIERRDSNFTMRVAKFGEPFVPEEVKVLNIEDEVYVGLFVSTSKANLVKALFKDVRITVPVDPGLALLRTNIGSAIEILEVETGNRKIVSLDSASMYSPVFSKSGKSIIYSKEGFLYNYDLDKEKSEVIYTGDKKCHNNDHVLSPDGNTLAICIKMPEKGGAILHTVAVTGGLPKPINNKGATYPHSWSPDGKLLLFARSSDGKFDIYKVPVKGGREIRLTKAEGRDDGPEFSPDGKYIYFNSNRKGTMQIWRMDQDGSNEVEITNGEFHDWFPHISPNGKWIVFLSYKKDEVSSASNPYYKQVYLRLMPVAGGKPKIIAYLYGGNGTMNSPCWSPDSKTITFASNSDIKQ